MHGQTDIKFLLVNHIPHSPFSIEYQNKAQEDGTCTYTDHSHVTVQSDSNAHLQQQLPVMVRSFQYIPNS